MTAVRLYSQSINPFSEKVACALAIKGVEWVRIEVSDPDEIKRLSPESQTLPVLEVDGRRMSESAAIVRWIDELYPEPPLFASEPKTRSQQEGLANWSDTSFAFYWNRWRAARAEHERLRATRRPGLLSRIQRHAEARKGIEPDDGSGASDAELEIMAEVAKRVDDLVAFLGNRSYFYANRPSVADLAVYGMLLILRSGPMPGSAELLASRPTLAAHLERMIQHSRGHAGGRRDAAT